MKLSQEKLADLAGLSMASISELERGKGNPTLETLQGLAKVFNISVMELIDYESALTDGEKVKKVICESLEHLDVKQLQSVLSFIKTVRQ
jgi:Predicted transcriptional regulators